MLIRQISIFAENRPGAILEITDVLGKADINIWALSVADTSDFGVVRIITEETDRAMTVLRENHFTASLTNVLSIKIENKSGSFHSILKALAEKEISVEYSYAYAAPECGATIIIKCRDEKTAAQHLVDSGFTLVSE